MNKGLKIFTLCALCALIPAVAYADIGGWRSGRSVFIVEACELMLRTFNGLRGAVYVMSACGLAIISIQASVLGKFGYGNFAGLGGGLFILSSIEPVIAILTDNKVSFDCSI